MTPVEYQIVFLDEFPYGGDNKVQIFLGSINVSKSIAALLFVYAYQFCNADTDYIRFIDHSIVIRTGEGFTKEDFKDFVSQVLTLPPTVKE